MSKLAHIYPLEHPIHARVTVPGSKSFTNRALVIAALANGTSVLHGAANANDSIILVKILKQLGVEIESNGDNITVKGNGAKFNSFNGELNVEDAGTVMRFLSALCCIIPGDITLKGSERMHERPIHGLVNALKQLGAKIDYLGKEGFPPIKINGTNFKGGKVHIDASMSSQFVSALLMIAPILSSDTEIICGDKLASLPYIDMTISVMRHFGVEVKHDNHRQYYIKGKQQYKAAEYNIEGDASSASYMLAIAAVSGSRVEVTNLSSRSLQSDARFADILGQMGCSIMKHDSIEVIGNKELKAIDIDMSDMPDTAQTLAVVAAFAKGYTIIKGLDTLEHKETKRLTALQTELTKMGIECKIHNNSILIKGGKPNGVLINTYHDHRMAMAFAVAGTSIPGISIEASEVVKKSFPEFWNTLVSMGIKLELK